MNKITVHEKSMSGHLGREVNVVEAIKDTIKSNIDFYSRGSEAISEKVEKQSELIAKLFEILVSRNLITADEMDEVLCHKYGASE